MSKQAVLIKTTLGSPAPGWQSFQIVVDGDCAAGGAGWSQVPYGFHNNAGASANAYAGINKQHRRNSAGSIIYWNKAIIYPGAVSAQVIPGWTDGGNGNLPDYTLLSVNLGANPGISRFLDVAGESFYHKTGWNASDVFSSQQVTVYSLTATATAGGSVTDTGLAPLVGGPQRYIRYFGNTAITAGAAASGYRFKRWCHAATGAAVVTGAGITVSGQTVTVTQGYGADLNIVAEYARVPTVTAVSSDPSLVEPGLDVANGSGLVLDKTYQVVGYRPFALASTSAPRVLGYHEEGTGFVGSPDTGGGWGAVTMHWQSPPAYPDGDVVITIFGEQTRWKVTAAPNAAGGTILLGGGAGQPAVWVEKDTPVPVAATAPARYKVSGFIVTGGAGIVPGSEAAAGYGRTAQVRHNGADGTVTPVFEPAEWQLSARMSPESGAGSVYIDSPGQNDKWYPLNAQVSANVFCVPLASKKVRDWTTPWGVRPGSAGASSALSVGAQSASVTVTANIIDRAYSLTVGKGGNPGYGVLAALVDGLVQVAEEFTKSVDGGASVKITATPDYGRKLLSWNYSGVTENPNGNVFGFTMPDAPVTVTAVFDTKAAVALTVGAVNDDGGHAAGTVTLRRQDRTPEGATTLQEPERVFNIFAEERYVLAATDNDNDYTFLEWRDGSNARVEGDAGNPLQLSFMPLSGGALAYRAVYVLRRSEPIEIIYTTEGGEFLDPATLDGCLLTITTPPSGTDDDGDPVWLVGYNRVIAFTANGKSVTDGGESFWWGIKVVNVISVGDGVSIPINVKNAPLEFSGTFLMRDKLRVELVLVKVLKPDWRSVTLAYMPCCDRTAGAFSVYPVDKEESGFTEDAAGVINVMQAKDHTCTISACPAPGYAFEGWYRRNDEAQGTDDEFVKVSGVPVFDFIVPNMASAFYVKFAESGKSVQQWNAGDEVLIFNWRSKVFVASVPFNPSCARVYSDSYPLLMRVHMASSPHDVMNGSRMREVQVRNQDPFRLPMRRPEKYMAIEIAGNARVSFVAVGTSMEGLKNGR